MHCYTHGLGWSPFARHYLGNHCLFSFPPGTKMFQFPGLALCYCRVTVLQTAGLSHSEIPGSMVICTYPRLIAAYHVLHRLHEPRHPPCALSYFLYDISFPSALLPRSAEPLILSAVLIVKFFTCVLLRFGNSLKLNFKSYFLQFVLCQYVKDLLDSFVRGEIPESNRNYNRFS